MATTSTTERERLEAADFELAAGEVFDAVGWLNKRLSRGNVTYDRLDQHLSSLGTACQLLCQKTSDEIEVAANHLVTQLPSTSRNLERMQQETLRGHSELGKVLEGLKDADDRKHSGLQGLAEIDAVKTRVETACSALREVGSWDRKVRDCDQMTHAGNLPAALSQLAALKDVLEAFKMLPEYPKKEGQLTQLEDDLVKAAKRKTKIAIDQNTAADLKACCEVFACAGRHNEPCAIANEVFFDLANKAFQNKSLRADAPATEVAAAVMAVFEVLHQGIEDRWQMLETLDAGQVPPVTDAVTRTPSAVSPSSPTSGAIVSVARSGLGVLCAELKSRLLGKTSGGEASTPADSDRESGAFALLAAYVDGLRMLRQCTPMQVPGMWLELCRENRETGVSVLPWSLLREVAVFVIWRPMQDAATALIPPISSNMSPSEAVLTAESNAKRLLQMPSTWAKRLESHGAAQLAVVWLACIDITLATFWGRWDKLIETFQNTLHGKVKGGQAESSFDASLLNESMQLHNMLHDSLAKHFQEFQRESLHHAVGMHSKIDTPFGHAVAEMMQDPEHFCDSLAVPSAASLQSAKACLEGLGPESSMLAARATKVLPAAAAALAESEKKVRSLVTRCCVQPVHVILNNYAESHEWNKQVEGSDSLLTGGLNPLPFISAVGEHLFALVPQLESSQDSSQLAWLPTIIEEVLQELLQKVLQIKSLSVVGGQQLLADLEYLLNITEALGGGSSSATTTSDGTTGGAAGEVREFVEALSHFSRQQIRFHDCAAKGHPFSEEPREGSGLNRRFERSLRAAMALP